jgi:ATP-dependent DNA helicase DinG
MNLPQRVASALAADGVLARGQPQWTTRAGQLQMAQAVAQTMEEGGVLVVEAGTGIGKTYAYLVPALLSGQRVLVSTASKALQDQLFHRDLPRLMSALEIPLRAVMLKGRSSYLCTQRLLEARHADIDWHRVQQREIADVEQWARLTTTGDLSEVPTLEEDSPVMALVSSTRDNCLGSGCPHAGTCYVNNARKSAMAADLVVVNHHLFFADLQFRESGIVELLPSVTAVVLDEAHQLEDIGLQFLAQQWSTHQLIHFLKDLEAAGPNLAWVTVDWRVLVGAAQGAASALQSLVSTQPGRVAWLDGGPAGVDPQCWSAHMQRLLDCLRAAASALAAAEDAYPAWRVLLQRLQALCESVTLFAMPVLPGRVRWVEVAASVRFLESPLSVANTLAAMVTAQVTDDGPGPRSWVFTSATLGHDAQLSWFIESSGLHGASVLQVESPFDYAAQAAMYVPQHLPIPADPMHSDCVALLIAQAAEVLGGRTLVLTTTLRAMRSIGDALLQSMTPNGGIDVLVQGQGSKRELVDRFSVQGSHGRRGVVLVASAAFWQGFDMPGDALQMVVIDKLPFAPPDDPVLSARASDLEAAGRKPFVELHLPRATVALKQGAGRLIRRESDRGVLVICDVRLTRSGYGKKMLRALPAMTNLQDHTAFMQYLVTLTKSSTMDPNPA